MTVCAVHKGYMPIFGPAFLERMLQDWLVVFANEVFVIFATPRVVRNNFSETEGAHCQPIRNFLNASREKRRKDLIVFIHIPKTAGTSLWSELASHFPSNLYFAKCEHFQNRKINVADFDLIGGHIFYSLVETHIRPTDWIIGVLRNPIDRLCSAINHNKRAGEDQATFGPVMKAMRQQDLLDFLSGPGGETEVRHQLLVMGGRYEDGLSQDDDTMLRNAMALITRPRSIFCTVGQLHYLPQVLEEKLGIKMAALQKLNANSGDEKIKGDVKSSLPETLQSSLRANELLYNFASDRFIELI